MARKTKADRQPKEPTERQVQIKALQSLGRGGRDSEQSEELKRLMADERRDRFTRLHVRRVRNARKALANVVRMASPQSYQYTPEEAASIVEVLTADLAEVKRAFTGTVKEKGLYDL